MRNRKKRRKGEEGSQPSRSAQPAQCAHAGPASRPRLPRPPARPALPAAAATWAHASAARCSPARPSSLRRSRCQRTPPVSHPLLIFPTPRPTVSRPEADSECRAGQGVTPEPWPCPPWRSAHANAMPTTHAPQAARCARRDPQPSAVELEAPAIRAPAPEP